MSLPVDLGIMTGFGVLMLGLFKFTANKLSTKQDVAMCNIYHKQVTKEFQRSDTAFEKLDKRLESQHLELVNIGKELALLTQGVKSLNNP